MGILLNRWMLHIAELHQKGSARSLRSRFVFLLINSVTKYKVSRGNISHSVNPSNMAEIYEKYFLQWKLWKITTNWGTIFVRLYVNSFVLSLPFPWICLQNCVCLSAGSWAGGQKSTVSCLLLYIQIHFVCMS